MIEIEHLNFGWLHSPPIQPACCHCIVIRDEQSVVLVDSGIGLHDIANPNDRVGPDAIAAAGFKFLTSVAAATQLAERGIAADDVTDIVLTHCDPDHAGGLSDFPTAAVHLSAEELASLKAGNIRYRDSQFDHNPHWVTYDRDDSDFFGLPSRRVQTSLEVDIRLVPLFGHTLGHCGVAIKVNGGWLLHVGDAYYLRAELFEESHPIDDLAEMAAENDAMRRESLARLRDLLLEAPAVIAFNGYHDTSELPAEVPELANCS